MSPEEQALVERLRSRFWRLDNLYWLQDQNGKKVKFRLRWAQRDLLKGLWYFNMVLKVRQIGISTFVGLLQLDRSLFTKDHTSGIIDKTMDDAKKKLGKIEFAYDHLDDVEDPRTAPLGALIKQAVKFKIKNTEEMEFTNGSKIWAGTSLRGGTVNFLHVSEFGYIASETPDKASEIASGSFNTVHPGNVIIVESTHEGGRYGLNYQLVRQSQATSPNPETPLDWKFHFFPWHKEPLHTLPLYSPIKILKEHADYFAELERNTGIKLSPEQKHWYIKKAQTPGVDMARQYPGTSEEALQALRPGAIYGKEILALRQGGRIRDFVIEGHGPLITAWDIGISDYCCIWLLQLVGLDILAVDYVTFHGEKPAYYAAKVMEWEKQYDRKVSKNYLPHDAAHVIKMAGNKSWRDLLLQAGLSDIVVVPRTPDFWVGIQHLRSLLPRFYFHATNCSKDIVLPGAKIILPAGLSALSGYHTVVEAVGGKVVENPVHDQSSHGADALRTFAEAHSRGMLQGGTQTATEHRRGRFSVQTGIRQREVVRGPSEPSGIQVIR